jgi:hypothetical protein
MSRMHGGFVYTPYANLPAGEFFCRRRPTMHHIIKSFFYSVALLTLYWVTQTPADSVTFTAWVQAVQSVEAQQCAAILTTVVEFADSAIACILGAPKMLTQVGFSQVPQQRR